MPVRRVIDLSMPLDERTPLYPGDPEPKLCAAQTACARLLDAGGRSIGIDAINLDEPPAGDLDLERFRCHAPIRIAGGDGAPARAVAIEGFT
jgi:kynurenine formamidase